MVKLINEKIYFMAKPILQKLILAKINMNEVILAKIKIVKIIMVIFNHG
jgi:hypothetical protein